MHGRRSGLRLDRLSSPNTVTERDRPAGLDAHLERRIQSARWLASRSRPNGRLKAAATVGQQRTGVLHRPPRKPARQERQSGNDRAQGNLHRPRRRDPQLHLRARSTPPGKFDQTYGRFEARIKIPYGQGIWPAFWMLGNDIKKVGWPTCGEIDIVENIGREPAIVHGTIHGPGYSGGKGIGASYTRLPQDALPTTITCSPPSGNPTRFASMWTITCTPLALPPTFPPGQSGSMTILFL